ncbi:Nucleotide-binding universal stress protein, UspA family [Acinetobacter marinus]|uniref:Universal stress protein n=1 Tax=Acinetobacter marinus TaxID=281375 RepID=A0A1G6MZR7_9GAMM|nr:universal stress protein [Acinetobacter marinus]SDC60921.1 Nucleotide-binding universal stress protein, UspA family [Acinetobacter marinus]
MSYQHIVVPVDGSDTALSAIKQAAQLAKAFDSKVTLLCVISVDPFVGIEFFNAAEISEQYLTQARDNAQRILAKALQSFAEFDIQADQKIIEGQIIHEEIVQAAADLNADLVVIGSHGRKGLKKMMLGSVAQSVLGEIHTPVLVVRE